MNIFFLLLILIASVAAAYSAPVFGLVLAGFYFFVLRSGYYAGV